MLSASQIIRKSMPDVAVLQEIDASLMSLLEPGLDTVLKRGAVSLNDSIAAKDGVGVYYNPSRFKLVDQRTVRFATVVEKHLPQLVESARSDSSSLSLIRALERELREKLNQVVMIRLKDIEFHEEIVACSSHLYWDPSYPDLKLLQSYILAKEVNEFSRDCAGVVLGADLNSVPDSSAVYELLMGVGKVETTHPQHPVSLRSPNNVNSSRLRGIGSGEVPSLELLKPFRSAFKEINGTEPRFTNFTSTFKGCLDYVMLSGKLKAHSCEALLDENALSEETALPNSKMPSDHLPLVVDVAYS